MENPMRFLVIACLLIVAATPALAQAPCGPVDHAAALAEAWLKREPAKSPGPALSMPEAICTQAALVKRLSASQGRVIGYKAGLTSPTAQQQIGVPHPVAGVLLEKMLLKDGAVVPAKFGPRPLFEADLLVTVRDAGINQAKTPLDVARHLTTLQPFIELPDLVVAQGEPMTGPVVVAINVGARLGVVGEPRVVLATPEFVEALATMQVILTADGEEVSRAPGKLILDHPLNAVIYLAEELQRRGSSLKAGDILSLGSFRAVSTRKCNGRVG
jgi:2-keto-4-pentenoate hydratase